MAKIIKIDSNLLLNIISKNLDFPIVKHPVVGSVIRLPARAALSYAIITSHGYLDEEEPDNIFRLTRDDFRIFNQALRYDLQEGIFSLSDLRLVTTIYNEILKKPYLARNDKFILPIEYTKYQEFKNFLKQIIEKLKNNDNIPNDFIIAPIRKTSSGVSELESFFEYVVSIYFNRRQYITDTQIPFFYGIGTPDITAYRIPVLLDILAKYGFVEKGSSIVDLMTISSFGFHKNKQIDRIDDESIVFEVKTGQLTAPQIKKYTKTKIFNKAYEVIPSTKKAKRYAGLIAIDKNGYLKTYESNGPISFSNEKQKEYFEWIETYLKMYVIANLQTQELERMVQKYKFVMSIGGLIDFVKKIKFEELIKSVKNIIESR